MVDLKTQDVFSCVDNKGNNPGTHVMFQVIKAKKIKPVQGDQGHTGSQETLSAGLSNLSGLESQQMLDHGNMMDAFRHFRRWKCSR